MPQHPANAPAENAAACRLSRENAHLSYRLPSRPNYIQPPEETMLLATGVTVAGYAIEITFHDAVVIGLAILISLAFWAVLHFSRKRVVYLSHSEATNQIML